MDLWCRLEEHLIFVFLFHYSYFSCSYISPPRCFRLGIPLALCVSNYPPTMCLSLPCTPSHFILRRSSACPPQKHEQVGRTAWNERYIRIASTPTLFWGLQQVMGEVSNQYETMKRRGVLPPKTVKVINEPVLRASRVMEAFDVVEDYEQTAVETKMVR